MNFSVVIPVYNSTSSLEILLEEISSYFSPKGLTYEVILVDDASQEATVKAMDNLRLNDDYGKLIRIRLSHNVGQQRALAIGLKHASGKYAITMDDDLQHDIQTVEEMLKAAQMGADLVYGVYEVYNDHQSRAWGSKIIAIFFKIRYHKALKGNRVSSFRLIHEGIYRALPKEDKPFVYLSAELLPLSSQVANVMVERRERVYGKSGYSLTKCIQIGLKLFFHYGIIDAFNGLLRRSSYEAHAHGRRRKLSD